MGTELSDQDRERIRAEEIFRFEVRKGIEHQEPEPSKWRQVCGFLNSTFGNFVCVAIVVPLFIWLFSAIQSNYAMTRVTEDLVRRLDTEISFRLRSYWYKLEKASTRAEVGEFVKSLDAEKWVFPEFSDRPMVSLMTELSRLIPEDRKADVEKARDALSRRNRNELTQVLTTRNWIRVPDAAQQVDSVDRGQQGR